MPADLSLATVHGDECGARAVGIAGISHRCMPDFLRHSRREWRAPVLGAGNNCQAHGADRDGSLLIAAATGKGGGTNSQ